MRNVYDQYAKDALCALLSPAGPIKTEQEVSPEAQRIDLYFTPDASRAAALGPLGLLGRLTARPCSLEHFHDPPSVAALVACLRKHLNLCHVLAQPPGRLPPPQVWVLSSGRPTSALSDLRIQPAQGLPRGCYLAAPALHFGVVVLSELRRTRETLALRLLGTGVTLRRAVAELRRLPEDALEVQVILPIMLRYRLAVPADPGEQTDQDKEFLMSTQDALDLFVEQVKQSSLVAGARENLRLVLSRRRLTPSVAEEARIDACSDLATLKRWLAQAVTAESVAEALA